MQKASRRKFLKTGFVTGGALATGISAIGWNASKQSHRGVIRLLPVEGVAYSESFLRFMKRAKFDSVRDAIASIRDRSIPVRVAHAGSIANDLN
jgi:hypothetical protein